MHQQMQQEKGQEMEQRMVEQQQVKRRKGTRSFPIPTPKTTLIPKRITSPVPPTTLVHSGPELTSLHIPEKSVATHAAPR